MKSIYNYLNAEIGINLIDEFKKYLENQGFIKKIQGSTSWNKQGFPLVIAEPIGTVISLVDPWETLFFSACPRL